jgi:hypothetical protein
MQGERGDDIAAALDRLHAGGWSVGDTAFSEPGGTFHLVVNKEELSGWDMCRGGGSSCSGIRRMS